MRVTQALGLAVFTACTALGLVLWVGWTHWPGYFVVLDAHLAAGIALTVLAAPALVIHLRRYRSSARRFRQAAGWTIAAGIVLFVARDHTPLEGYFVFALSLICVTTGLLLALTGWSQPRRYEEDARPLGGRHGFSLALACLAAVATGWLALYLRSDEAQVPRKWHSALGLVVVFLLAGHLPMKYLPVKTPRWLLATLCAAALGFWYAHYHYEHVVEIYPDGVVARWETAPAPASVADLVAGRWTTFELDAERGSESCAASGCHEDLHRQWRGSAHRFSADNDFYRKVVGLFVEEQGPEAAGFCARCHDPVRVFNGTVAEAYADGAPPPGEGVSCIGCHVALDAPEPHRNGVVTFRRPRPYPGEDDATRATRIGRDPRFHMRNFLVEDFHIHGPSCIPCHRVELHPDDGFAGHAVLQSVLPEDYPGGEYAPKADEEGDFAQVEREYYGFTGCIECHLVVPGTFADHVLAEDGYRGAYGIYPHFMPGVNSDLALYASHPDRDEDAIRRAAERVEEFLGGDVQEDCQNPVLRRAGDERGGGGAAAQARHDGVLTLEVFAERAPGSLDLRTVTWNYRAAHPFPIGPFDLFEVWQEVIVRDGGGRVVFHAGALDDRRRVDPDAHRLGATELNADGEPIERHRIWTIAEVADKRVIHSELGARRRASAVRPRRARSRSDEEAHRDA